MTTWATLPPNAVSPTGVPLTERLRWWSSSTSAASEAPWKTTWSWARPVEVASRPAISSGYDLDVPPVT